MVEGGYNCGVWLKVGVSVVEFGGRLVYLCNVWWKTGKSVAIMKFLCIWFLVEGWYVCGVWEYVAVSAVISCRSLLSLYCLALYWCISGVW